MEGLGREAAKVREEGPAVMRHCIIDCRCTGQLPRIKLPRIKIRVSARDDHTKKHVVARAHHRAARSLQCAAAWRHQRLVHPVGRGGSATALQRAGAAAGDAWWGRLRSQVLLRAGDCREGACAACM